MYSATPYYDFPSRYLLNGDFKQLIFIFIIIWKLYYFFTSDKTSWWNLANSSYKTTNYIFKTINNLINTFIIFILIVYLIGFSILYK